MKYAHRVLGAVFVICIAAATVVLFRECVWQECHTYCKKQGYTFGSTEMDRCECGLPVKALP
jgi:hypothetical protein